MKATFSAVVALAAGIHLNAQIAVSANDGKQVRPGDDPTGIRQDTVSTIDLIEYPPKVLATINVPASMIGPPDSVVVTSDSSLAIVTCAQKVGLSDPANLIAADTVSLLDISDPRKPKLIQTVVAEPGASGVSINPDGNLVLVANTSGSVSVFSLAYKKLTKTGDVQMEEGSGPTDAVFSRDGKLAYVVERGGNRITILDVDGTKVTRSGRSIVTGVSPYGMAITPDGRYAVNTNLRGAIELNSGQKEHPNSGSGAIDSKGIHEHQTPMRRTSMNGTITLIDLQTNHVIDSAVVGQTPEHVAVSPNGRYAEVTVANGAASSAADPTYRTTHGLMLVFGVAGGKLTKLASADTGHWCQGATWNKDSSEILLQCATERHIEVYQFDGSTLRMDHSATLDFEARPGAIATATNQ